MNRARLSSAEQLVQRYQVPLSKVAHALLSEDQEPAAYFRALLQAGHERDARSFLAHALPRRRGLWWACLCAADVLQRNPQEGPEDDTLTSSLQLAARYVRQPSEEGRREAERLFRALEKSSLAGHLAGAVFYCDGSIAPSHAAPVPAPPQILGRFVSTAVYLAAIQHDVRQYRHRLREYLRMGQEVAEGQHLWQTSTSTPRILIDPPQTSPPAPAGSTTPLIRSGDQAAGARR